MQALIGALPVELRQVLGDGAPLAAGRGEVAVEARGVLPHVRLRFGRARRERDAILPEHVGGHALPHALFVNGIGEQRAGRRERGRR